MESSQQTHAWERASLERFSNLTPAIKVKTTSRTAKNGYMNLVFMTEAYHYLFTVIREVSNRIFDFRCIFFETSAVCLFALMQRKLLYW